MEDMASAYYHPHAYPHHQAHYPYYQYPPPPGAGVPPPPPAQQPPPLPQPHYPPQYSQPHHHQPSYGTAYGLPPLQPSQDEVRTLFIAGLPDDVKPREIYNLFWDFPGYKSSQVRCSGQSSQAFAFAVFTDKQSALAAMHELNGLIFDLERESTLHIDLAKSNSRSKRSRTDDDMSYSSDKKVRGPAAYSRGYPDSGVGSNIHLPGMGNSAYNMYGYPSTQSYANFDYAAVNEMDPNKSLDDSSTAHVSRNNTPCPTLFVANLGPTCTEQELTQVFSRCPGFLKLKMQNKKGVPVSFVDFQDVASSTAALNHLQGTVLYSSNGVGMRLEYAKTRMGLRKRERS